MLPITAPTLESADPAVPQSSPAATFHDIYRLPPDAHRQRAYPASTIAKSPIRRSDPPPFQAVHPLPQIPACKRWSPLFLSARLAVSALLAAIGAGPTLEILSAQPINSRVTIRSVIREASLYIAVPSAVPRSSTTVTSEPGAHPVFTRLRNHVFQIRLVLPWMAGVHASCRPSADPARQATRLSPGLNPGLDHGFQSPASVSASSTRPSA